MKEASKLNNSYSDQIDIIPKFIELEKNKKKNYQDYIKLGDLLSSEIFITSTQCNLEAIKNYEKALELNPNAYEVYEKIARAYKCLEFEYSILVDFPPDAELRKIAQEC